MTLALISVWLVVASLLIVNNILKETELIFYDKEKRLICRLRRVWWLYRPGKQGDMARIARVKQLLMPFLKAEQRGERVSLNAYYGKEFGRPFKDMVKEKNYQAYCGVFGITKKSSFWFVNLALLFWFVTIPVVFVYTIYSAFNEGLKNNLASP